MHPDGYMIGPLAVIIRTFQGVAYSYSVNCKKTFAVFEKKYLDI